MDLQPPRLAWRQGQAGGAASTPSRVCHLAPAPLAPSSPPHPSHTNHPQATPRLRQGARGCSPPAPGGSRAPTGRAARLAQWLQRQKPPHGLHDPPLPCTEWGSCGHLWLSHAAKVRGWKAGWGHTRGLRVWGGAGGQGYWVHRAREVTGRDRGRVVAQARQGARGEPGEGAGPAVGAGGDAWGTGCQGQAEAEVKRKQTEGGAGRPGRRVTTPGETEAGAEAAQRAQTPAAEEQACPHRLCGHFSEVSSREAHLLPVC